MIKVKIEKSLILTADVLVLCFSCYAAIFSVSHLHKFLTAVDNKNLERSFVIKDTKKLIGITIGLALAFIYFFCIDKYLERHSRPFNEKPDFAIVLLIVLIPSLLLLQGRMIKNFQIERKSSLETNVGLHTYNILFMIGIFCFSIWTIYEHCLLKKQSTDLPITKLLDCIVQKVTNCFKIQENYD